MKEAIVQELRQSRWIRRGQGQLWHFQVLEGGAVVLGPALQADDCEIAEAHIPGPAEEVCQRCLTEWFKEPTTQYLASLLSQAKFLQSEESRKCSKPDFARLPRMTAPLLLWARVRHPDSAS